MHSGLGPKATQYFDSVRGKWSRSARNAHNVKAKHRSSIPHVARVHVPPYPHQQSEHISAEQRNTEHARGSFPRQTWTAPRAPMPNGTGLGHSRGAARRALSIKWRLGFSACEARCHRNLGAGGLLHGGPFPKLDAVGDCDDDPTGSNRPDPHGAASPNASQCKMPTAPMPAKL